MTTTVRIDRTDAVWTVTIARAEVRNAVDGPTARALTAAFRAFDDDAGAKVAVLCGEGAHFCAGADLRTVADGGLGDAGSARALVLSNDMADDGPMGPSRLELGKPVIAAIEGYAVAGGLELALWCDLRVASSTAIFGVFCRRFGVPLVDGGTVRLPRLIGESRAMDLILTGRAVGADEALALGLANRVVGAGEALAVRSSSPARSPPFRSTACATTGPARGASTACRWPTPWPRSSRSGGRRSPPAKRSKARAPSFPAPAGTAASPRTERASPAGRVRKRPVGARPLTIIAA